MERATDFLLSIAFIFSALVAGYAYGVHQANDVAEAAERGRTAAAVKAQKAADDKVLADERELRRLDADTFANYKRSHEDADKQTQAVISDLRSGARRLRPPAKCEVRAAAPDAGGPAPEPAGDEGRGELSPDASVFVVGLLKRGDDAIRKHAAVVDLYENLRAACSKEAPEPGTP